MNRSTPTTVRVTPLGQPIDLRTNRGSSSTPLANFDPSKLAAAPQNKK